MNISPRSFTIIFFMGLTVCLPLALISYADELNFSGKNADRLKRAVS